MDNVKLEKLGITVVNPCFKSQSVSVTYDYQELSSRKIRFFLRACLGDDTKHCKFLFNAIYTVYLRHDYSNQDEMMNDALHMLIESYTKVILFIDKYVEEKDA